MDALSRECLRRTPVQISLLLMLFELSGCHGEGFIGGYMSTPKTSWSGAVSSARLGPITLLRTSPGSGSSAGPYSAASSTSTSESRRSPGQDRWPSSGTSQGRLELPPRRARAAWRWIDSRGVQDLPHGQRRNRHAEFRQLAVDATVSPQWIFLRQANDQAGGAGGIGGRPGPHWLLVSYFSLPVFCARPAASLA